MLYFTLDVQSNLMLEWGFLLFLPHNFLIVKYLVEGNNLYDKLGDTYHKLK